MEVCVILFIYYIFLLIHYYPSRYCSILIELGIQTFYMYLIFVCFKCSHTINLYIYIYIHTIRVNSTLYIETDSLDCFRKFQFENQIKLNRVNFNDS